MSANFAFRRPNPFDALRRRLPGEAPRTQVLLPADLGTGAEVGKVDPVLNGTRQLPQYATPPFSPTGQAMPPTGWGGAALTSAEMGAGDGIGGAVGGALGGLAVHGLGKLLHRDPPKAGMPQPGALGKLPLFGAGGRLRRLGDAAIVGDAGPELAVRDEQGVQVIPLDQQPPMLTRKLAALSAQQPTDTQPQATQPTPAPFKRFLPTEPPLSTDTSISNEGITPKLTRPLPELPDRTLSVDEAQQNLAQYLRGQRQQRIGELSDPHFQPPKGQGGFKQRLVRGLKVGGEVALDNLGQTGNPLSAAGAFLGGGAVGVADRRSQGRYLARKELGQLQQAEQYDLARQGEQAKIDDQTSQTALRNAQIPYWQQRPANEQTKITAQAIKNQQTAIKSELSVRLKDPRPFDANAPYDGDLLERAQAAGVSFDPGALGDMKNPATMEILDPTDPSGTRKTRVRYNRQTGAFEPVTVGDKPVQTGYAQPVISSGPDAGMTPAAARAARDRGVGQAETGRHNRATENQGAQRIGITRENQGRRGTPTAVNTNARLARAAELQRRLDEEKTKAANPPRSVKGADGSWQPTDDKYRAAYTARHKQAAAGYRDQIKNAYSDIYEVGEDQAGWVYAKPKIQPNAGAQAGAPQGGAYAGHRFSRSQLPEIRKRLGVGSDAEAERIITEQGGVIY